MVLALPEWLKAIALRRMYGDPARVMPDTLQGYTAGLRLPGTVEHILEALRVWSDDMLRLRALLPPLAATPTLLLWGDRDRAVSLASGRELLRYLPEATLVILSGVGHIPFEEAPELCNPIMCDWLTGAIAERRGGAASSIQRSEGSLEREHAWAGEGRERPSACDPFTEVELGG